MHTYIHAIFGVWAHTYNQKILKYIFFFFRKAVTLFCFVSLLFLKRIDKKMTRTYRILFMCFFFFCLVLIFLFREGGGRDRHVRRQRDRKSVHMRCINQRHF